MAPADSVAGAATASAALSARRGSGGYSAPGEAQRWRGLGGWRDLGGGRARRRRRGAAAPGSAGGGARRAAGGGLSPWRAQRRRRGAAAPGSAGGGARRVAGSAQASGRSGAGFGGWRRSAGG